ncbi:hypothetical protein ACFWAP_03730 [Streptomyces goshikiensis]|uniref:hypothetical protein n=1 Tax=Streptomyces goshikiensis TaxID=1942 RepID=UPI003665F36E
MRDHPALSAIQTLMASPPCPPSYSTAGITRAAQAFAALTDTGTRNAEIFQLGEQAGLVLAHGGDDFDPHFADPSGTTTRCGQDAARWLNEELAARVSVLCPACEESATGQAEAPEPTPEPEGRRRRNLIHVHHFASTQAVREAANRNEIADEDVIVVPTEGVVGFVVVAYAVAITAKAGSLPHLHRPAREYAGGEWIESVMVAEREARALGLALRDERPAESDVPRAADHIHLATRPYAGPHA